MTKQKHGYGQERGAHQPQGGQPIINNNQLTSNLIQ